MHGHAIGLALAVGLCLVPRAGQAEDPFVDSRVTFTVGDDDLLHGADDSPSSPRLGIGDRPGYELFFDNLDTGQTGRETMTHLVLHRELPSFFDHLTTEAALVMRVLFGRTKEAIAFEDTGSYIRLTLRPWDDQEEGLSLVAFPFDSDRFRLGYLYDLSVAGDDFAVRRTWVDSPAAKVQLDYGRGYYFAGFKAVLDAGAAARPTDEQGSTTAGTAGDILYAALGGMGWDLFNDELRLDLGGAYFQQARSPAEGWPDETFFAAGGAARVVFHRNMPVEDSIDYALYRNDPNHPFLVFRPARYTPGERSFMLSAEVVALAQQLTEGGQFSETKMQRALAWAGRARFQQGYLRVELTGMWRDVPFLMLERLGLDWGRALPDGVEAGAELVLASTVDYHFPALHLTPALSAGVLLPASVTAQLTAQQVGQQGTTVIGEHTLVLRGDQRTLLPEGERPLPVFQSRLSVRLDLSELLYSLLWVQYSHDANSSTIAVNTDLTRSRVFVDADAFGLGISVALRL